MESIKLFATEVIPQVHDYVKNDETAQIPNLGRQVGCHGHGAS